MAKRPNLRLGVGGEMIPAGPNAKAQQQFLVSVRRSVSDAVAELMTVARAQTGVRYTDEQRFLSWSLKWHFYTDQWLRVYARRMVQFWRTQQDESKWPIFWGALTHSYRPPVVPPFPSWDPTEETEIDVRARFERYLAAVKQTPGLEMTPVKRTLEHFDWLALHHVGGLDFPTLAEDVPVGNRSRRSGEARP